MATDKQIVFYREWVAMAKPLDPREYGVDMDRGPFVDLMVEEFGTTYRGQLTVDELCLHPREALRFCDKVRGNHGFYDLPDAIILRTIMNSRKAN